MRTYCLELLLKNGWVILFFLVVSGLYLQESYSKKCLFETLCNRKEYLSQLKEKLEEEKQELLLRIESQTDPEWMELVLKKKLGVKSEEELKVVFQ